LPIKIVVSAPSKNSIRGIQLICLVAAARGRSKKNDGFEPAQIDVEILDLL
jgi:hypothetical protein